MKPTLALIHGWAVDSNIFEPIHVALEDSFGIFVHDLPGYGSRHKEAGNVSLQSLTDDALERIPRGAIWLGWSLGGTIAMNAAIQNSSHAGRLILVSTTPKFQSDPKWEFGIEANVIAGLESKFENSFPAALKRFLLMSLADPTGGRSIAVDAVQRCSQPPTQSTLVSGLNILRQTDLRDRVSKIDCPVQLIVGDNDKIVPAAASCWLKTAIPNAQLAQTSDGHLSFLESPEWFIERVTTFKEA